MKWESIIQISIIVFGLFYGVHFSKVAQEEHEKLGHSDLKTHQGMEHGTIDISREIIPEITDFRVLKDPMSGWNVYVQVRNFRFAPEHANQSHQQGEGHAHLYINGIKIARMYSNWLHIPELTKDKNEFKITLNSNDHQTFTIGEQTIQKTIIKEMNTVKQTTQCRYSNYSDQSFLKKKTDLPQ